MAIKTDLSKEVLDKDIKDNNLKNIYLLYGQESYLIDYYQARIKRMLVQDNNSLNFLQLSASNIDKFIDYCNVVPFMCDKKLVLVKNTGLFKTELKSMSNKQKDILEYLQNKLCSDTVILFVESEVKGNNTFFNAINKNGLCVELNYQPSNNLITWIKKKNTQNNIKFNDNDISYFIQECGPGMQDLENEYQKLIGYVADTNRAIEKATIDKVCIKSLESIIFSLIDNISNKSPNEAIAQLIDLLNKKEPYSVIILMLSRHFKNLYLTKELLSKNKNIETELGVKPFIARKYYAQSQKFTIEELRASIDDLYSYDIKVKEGNIDQKIALESFVCNYSKKSS